MREVNGKAMRLLLVIIIFAALALGAELLTLRDTAACEARVCPSPLRARFVSSGRYTRECVCLVVPE